MHFYWDFIENLLCMKKNYSLDCAAGEDEGTSGYFECAVHLLVDKMKLTHEFFKSMHLRCSYAPIYRNKIYKMPQNLNFKTFDKI